MATYQSDTTASTQSSSPAPAAVSAGTTPVNSTTFQQMLQILEDLNDHTHTVYDDYTSVCQCQCACSRGIL
jgi:hypothetical protein